MTTSTHSHCFHQHSLAMGFVWLASQETNAMTGDQITLFRQWSDNRDALGISLTALVWFVTTVHLVLGINGDKGLELPGAEISYGLEPVYFEGKIILSWVFISISILLDFSSKLKFIFSPWISLYSLQITSNCNC